GSTSGLAPGLLSSYSASCPDEGRAEEPAMSAHHPTEDGREQLRAIGVDLRGARPSGGPPGQFGRPDGPAPARHGHRAVPCTTYAVHRTGPARDILRSRAGRRSIASPTAPRVGAISR